MKNAQVRILHYTKALWRNRIAHPVPNWEVAGSNPVRVNARVAQWIACLTSDQEVAGSNPVVGSLKIEMHSPTLLYR